MASIEPFVYVPSGTQACQYGTTGFSLTLALPLNYTVPHLLIDTVRTEDRDEQ